MVKAHSIALVLALMACASAHAFAQSVHYVPGGCTLSTPTVTAQRGWNPWVVTGTVTLSNGQNYNVPLQSVQVAIGNTIPVAPMYVTASCPSSFVPFSPIPYQYGTLTCTYTAFLPFGWNRWPSSNPAAWTSIRATATISMSGAKCSSAVTPITGSCWGLSSSSQWGDVAMAGATVGVDGSMDQPSMVNTPVIGTTGSNTPVVLGSSPAATNIATAKAAGVSTSTGNRKLLQSVQFVPQGCSALTVAASAHFSGSNIVGSVTMSNPNNFEIPITKVQVELANNIPVAPMYVTANCGGATNVPFSSIPYQLGTLTCYFTQALPSNGPAASNRAWTGVKATATIGLSGATCPSPVAPVQDLVMGRK